MTDRATFRFFHPIEIRFSDLDGLGHVNNAVYFTYMELTRIRYLQTILGWDGEINKLNLILAHISADFKLPAFFRDTLRVYTGVTRLGRTSFSMNYTLIREEDEAVIATGESVQVVFDYETGKTAPIPETWRRKIADFETALEA